MLHKTRLQTGAAVLLALCPISFGIAYADTVTNISIPYGGGTLNPPGNWSTQINGASIVSAPTSGNTGTGINFSYWSGQFNEIDTNIIRTFSFAPVALTSGATVNTLLNTFYGSSNLEATVVFTNSLGAAATYGLNGDQTIRDYNNNVFTDDLLGYNTTPGLGAVTAQNWWNNGVGQRLDVQSFVLPTSWAGTDLTSMVIGDPPSSGAIDILSALQVDDASPTPPTTVTPEPSSFGLLGTGLLAAIGFVRRRL